MTHTPGPWTIHNDEEVLVMQEEFTTCDIHGTTIEYFTDCPNCIQEENDFDAYSYYRYLELKEGEGHV